MSAAPAQPFRQPANPLVYQQRPPLLGAFAAATTELIPLNNRTDRLPCPVLPPCQHQRNQRTLASTPPPCPSPCHLGRVTMPPLPAAAPLLQLASDMRQRSRGAARLATGGAAHRHCAPGHRWRQCAKPVRPCSTPAASAALPLPSYTPGLEHGSGAPGAPGPRRIAAGAAADQLAWAPAPWRTPVAPALGAAPPRLAVEPWELAGAGGPSARVVGPGRVVGEASAGALVPAHGPCKAGAAADSWQRGCCRRCGPALLPPRPGRPCR